MTGDTRLPPYLPGKTLGEMAYLPGDSLGELNTQPVEVPEGWKDKKCIFVFDWHHLPLTCQGKSIAPGDTSDPSVQNSNEESAQ